LWGKSEPEAENLSPCLTADDIIDWRQELVRYSLVERVQMEQQNPSGYQLHQLIWEYLRQKIATYGVRWANPPGYG
jgi:hypothetical protein